MSFEYLSRKKDSKNLPFYTILHAHNYAVVLKKKEIIYVRISTLNTVLVLSCYPTNLDVTMRK